LSQPRAFALVLELSPIRSLWVLPAAPRARLCLRPAHQFPVTPSPRGGKLFGKYPLTAVHPPSNAPLVRDGVLTGRYKKLFAGLVVGSGFAPLTPREELDYADGNPRFQLYDFNFTDDVRLIAREEGLIAINNALSVR
jgi:hypothetical protein